jgi:hypothetical protein
MSRERRRRHSKASLSPTLPSSFKKKGESRGKRGPT